MCRAGFTHNKWMWSKKTFCCQAAPTAPNLIQNAPRTGLVLGKQYFLMAPIIIIHPVKPVYYGVEDHEVRPDRHGTRKGHLTPVFDLSDHLGNVSADDVDRLGRRREQALAPSNLGDLAASIQLLVVKTKVDLHHFSPPFVLE